ncbi:MAG: nucleotidyltransferase domain-containing protein [Chromatiales bacterium]|nr:nucleotidyltransferase domain-containing protein [Chromatiales bacterium]
MRLSTPTSVHAAIGDALADVPDVAFALVFGSRARGTAHADSDIDVALDFGRGRRPGAYEIGTIVSRLEEAAGQSVDVVVLDDAPPGLAYRVFRDGVTVLVRDRSALVERKARAILEYLDFQPFEEALSKAVLARRSR